ncbi:aldehyde dehydrogenase family protein [Rhizobium leguminosarum bv. viciae]|nr:aldehyde dehydrogenase family protein [Rhizobium leguminosarum bv. viciae]
MENACALAEASFDAYREATPDERARFLERSRKIFSPSAMNSSNAAWRKAACGGGARRASGRTVGQLRLFASVLRDGRYLDIRIDKALPEWAPMPRPDIRLRHTGLGPVAVFGASNFPLAFSVAGRYGLGAGRRLPFIVKAHSGHRGTSELVGRAVQRAVRDCGMPEGVFSLLFDSGRQISQALVADQRVIVLFNVEKRA